MRVFPADDTAPRDVFIRTAQVLVEEQLRSLTYILRVAVPPSFYLMSALSVWCIFVSLPPSPAPGSPAPGPC